MKQKTDAVTTLLDYVIITGILMTLMIFVLGTINTVFMQGPSDTLKGNAYTDIGNGMSTRLVDFFVIAPPMGMGGEATQITLPEDVAGDQYSVTINATQAGVDESIIVGTGDQNNAEIKMGGIGATLRVNGTASSGSLVVIKYPIGGASP